MFFYFIIIVVEGKCFCLILFNNFVQYLSIEVLDLGRFVLKFQIKLGEIMYFNENCWSKVQLFIKQFQYLYLRYRVFVYFDEYFLCNVFIIDLVYKNFKNIIINILFFRISGYLFKIIRGNIGVRVSIN